MCCGSYLGYLTNLMNGPMGCPMNSVFSVLGGVSGSWRGLNCWLISDGLRGHVPTLGVLIPEARRALRE